MKALSEERKQDVLGTDAWLTRKGQCDCKKDALVGRKENVWPRESGGMLWRRGD